MKLAICESWPVFPDEVSVAQREQEEKGKEESKRLMVESCSDRLISTHLLLR